MSIALQEPPIQRAVTEQVACPSCGGMDFKVRSPSRIPDGMTDEQVIEFYSSSSDHKLVEQLVECSDCSLLYLNPRMRADLILQGYSEAVDDEFFRQNEMRIRTFRRNLLAMARRFFPDRTDLRVLDVGCAGGAFVKAATDLGYDAVGVEPSRYLCELGQHQYGLDLRPGTLGEQDLEPNSFDVVSLWDVLEHLTDPSEVVGEIHNLLRDGGYFIVSYPDYGSIARRLLGERWPFLLSVHLTYFTRHTLRQFLTDRGFAVREIRPLWQTLQLGYVLRRAADYFRVFALAHRAVDGLGCGRCAVTYNMGQSCVVAQKDRVSRQSDL